MFTAWMGIIGMDRSPRRRQSPAIKNWVVSTDFLATDIGEAQPTGVYDYEKDSKSTDLTFPSVISRFAF